MSQLELSPTDTIGDAFGHMESIGVTELPVVDRKRRILGTVTERALRQFVAQHGRVAMFAVTLAAVLEWLPRGT